MMTGLSSSPDSSFQEVSDYFHNRSAYCVLSVKVPDSFIALELAMAARFRKGSFPPGDRAVSLAENVCRRMSNIDFFAQQVSEAIAARNDTRRAWILNALLVAHFSACKSFLDAVSIALSDIYDLRLSNKEKDFGKPSIWKRLEKQRPEVYVRYSPFRQWMVTEVIAWRDAAVHRSAPIVIPTVGRNERGIVDADTMGFEIPLDRDIDHKRLWETDPNWIASGTPLHFHELWRDQFLSLCTESCRDIAALL